MNAVGFGTCEVLGTEKPPNQYHRLSMSESMDTMIFHENIIVETASSTKRI